MTRRESGTPSRFEHVLVKGEASLGGCGPECPCHASYPPRLDCARFGSTFLGSRAVTGDLVSDEQLAVLDSQGTSLLEALQTLEPGTDAAALEQLAYQPSEVDGYACYAFPCDSLSQDYTLGACIVTRMSWLCRYIEVHIEQGPVLESQGLPLGVVSGIVGETRFDVSMHGVQVSTQHHSCQSRLGGRP